MKPRETHTYKISGPDGVGYLHLSEFVHDNGKPFTTMSCTIEFREGMDIFKVLEDEFNAWGIKWEMVD